ncbi:hypothetical protein GCM10022280_25180 [Sphingomonas swuensis]|uniref:DUF4440 domain-containing protein n=1 Tax=Sphingomonas swuensis TaxID=977800 RepID=A0ABP7TAB7_9SPHN
MRLSAFLLLLGVAGCSPSLPSDSEVIGTLRANRADFEQARDIVLGLERQYVRLDLEDPSTLGALDAGERALMERLRERTGATVIQGGGRKGDERYVDFALFRWGFAFGGAMKSVSWRDGTMEGRRVLPSLDDTSDRRGFVTDTWFNAMRPIGGGWWMEVSDD